MEKTLYACCAVSLFCGVALCLCPEGSGKRALSFVCSVVILSAVINSIRGLDWEEYALEGARLREREQAFLEHNLEIRQELDRRVIEEGYEAYVMETAQKLALPLREVRVVAEWSLEGLWIPHSAVLTGECSEEQRGILASRLETDLGIPRERQEWRRNGE